MTLKPVDTAIVMVVGPCIDDTDFKSLEEAIAYNAAGMDVSLIIEKTDGTTAVTAITLTTGGTSDWTHKDGAYYEVEVTATQNAEEGIAYIRGVCTGVLPFESPRYEIVKANIYDSWIKGTDTLQTDLIQIGGSTLTATNLEDMADYGYDATQHKMQSDLIWIHGTSLVETTGQIAASFSKLFDVATPLLVASEQMRGTNSAYTGTPPTVTQIRTEMDTNSVDLNAILTDTNELQTNQGNWITATGFATSGAMTTAQNDLNTITGTDGVTLATAQSFYAPNKVVPDVAGTLATYDPPTNTEMIAAFTEIKGATWSVTDSLEAIRDRGDTTWTTATGFSIPNEYDAVIAALQTDLDNPAQYKATGFSTHSSDDVWLSTTRSLTDKVGFALSTAGIKAIWDQLTSALTTVGSIGKLLVDNINATISSRNSTVPDVAGTAATLHGVTNGKIDVVDTIVDAIKSKTDNLPSGIAKNEALPKFDFLMVLSSDHISGATGKTVTGQISKDGGVFTAITNTITEVSGGMYTIASGFTQTEMNANVITLQFSEGTCDTRTLTLITN